MSHSAEVPAEVLLITRIRTNNKGNQALSSAWAAMLAEAFPGAQVRALERRPSHVAQYTFDQLQHARDPFRLFDEMSSQLAKLAPGPGFISAPKGPPRIQLSEAITPEPMFAALRKRLNLRKWAARAGRYREDYRKRLAAIQRAQLVVVNPAGEFFPENPAPAFYHLLDAHVAKKLGRHTAIVNHTLDVNDPTLRKLIPRIYKDLDLVGFRDDKSIATFKAMGGDLANVLVTPDLALMTARPAGRKPVANRVAIAVHAPAASWSDRASLWVDVIAGLKAKGFDVVFVSNEVPADEAFYARVRERVEVPFEGKGLDYDRYCAMLGGFEFVVSSRMHTSILAMVAGTPVIPIEGPSFKISGLFAELGFDRQVIQPTQPGWVQQAIDAAVGMRGADSAAVQEVETRIVAARARITEALIPRLQQAGRA
ncbi:MAG TPA: polysaccharide pyruvyl transferase family protein [Kofleriaceae bacterium]